MKIMTTPGARLTMRIAVALKLWKEAQDKRRAVDDRLRIHPPDQSGADVANGAGVRRTPSLSLSRVLRTDDGTAV